ncbi:MAG TPA: hypothetical protein PLY80_17845, partial [Pseudomonadota bacterium]|nr:hypothetical protein [Pseudomonadota bacterium]
EAAGGAVAGGSGGLTVSVQLAATGGAQAVGSATLSGGAPGTLEAAGGAVAGGSGGLTVSVALTAAGFVQAMGVGVFWVTADLAASGLAAAGGSAGLTLLGSGTLAVDRRFVAAARRRSHAATLRRRAYEVRA